MTSNKIILPFLLALIILTSCKLTDGLKTIRIEIMKPVDFVIPENVKTVAIFNRSLHKNDTDTLYSFGTGNFECDTTVNTIEFSNSCVNGLAGFLEQEAYFLKVNNYRDSMNIRSKDPYLMFKSSDLFEITKADALIFLDLFQFENGVFSFYDATYRTRAKLSWTIAFRNETKPIIYDQIDTLFFNKSQYKDILHKNQHLQQIYQDASTYLGKYFGTKLIPSWSLDERSYYHSNHSEMQKAEKYAINHEWLKAGEIWNKQTKNKNQKIAAKACYNMALACEMEGKYDLAIYWLTESNNILTKDNYQHRAICQQYRRVLTLRKYEIEKLEKQVRN